MGENLKRFLQAAEENEELKSKLKALSGEETVDEIAALAKEYGFELTKEDFKLEDGSELEDAELAAVAGGGCNPDCKIGRVKIPEKKCGKGLWF